MSQKADGGGGNNKPRATSKRQERRLQDVWAPNLEDEITRLRDAVESHPFVGMDTLLPGIVARPTGPFGDYADYNYQTLKSNVDLTRALQISFTVCDSKGAKPKGISTWRFNFAFDTTRDLLGQEAIDPAGNSLDLARHSREGIDASQFGELLIGSGLVLSEEVNFVVFCGTCKFTNKAPEEKVPGRSGGELASTTFCGWYNFAYLLQLLTSQPLPEEMSGFRESLDLFFPSRCDVALHTSQLPPGPPLSSRDPADALRRPLYCGAQHVLEAFFRLPEGVRRMAFDASEESRIPESRQTEKHRRRGHGKTIKACSNGTIAGG
jgi:CCR4-NOT transcription complex subunit 7/8